MAADQARAERIKSLKAGRPDLTWSQIADAVGVRERSAIEWQKTGAIAHSNAVKLAEVTGVDADWLWRGSASDQSPDLMGALNGSPGIDGDQLDRIEAKLDEVLSILNRGPRLLAPDEPGPTDEERRAAGGDSPARRGLRG